jgi:cytochrome bd ubiquinol oxidase subunit II
MWLDDVWFALLVVIIAGYLILDGFDIGVGILLPFAGRSDAERRTVLNSVGPVWDGNEVWLVVGGGVLFGAFPIVYASVLSGFYWPIMLLLLGLILRTVAIEFRSRRRRPGWRATWDAVFFASSLALALLLGIAFGNILTGVPLNASGQIVIGSPLDLLHPFPLWMGLTTVVLLTLHGALYLNLKTEGRLQARLRGWIPGLFAAFAVVAAVTTVWLLLSGDRAAHTYRSDPWFVGFPLGVVAAFIVAASFSMRGGPSGQIGAFFASAVMLALLLASLAIGLYPDLLPSTIDPKYGMTVSNASSAPETLTVMLVFAVIGIPFVLLYTAGVQYLFRGKVQLTEESY